MYTHSYYMSHCHNITYVHPQLYVIVFIVNFQQYVVTIVVSQVRFNNGTLSILFNVLVDCLPCKQPKTKGGVLSWKNVTPLASSTSCQRLPNVSCSLGPILKRPSLTLACTIVCVLSVLPSHHLSTCLYLDSSYCQIVRSSHMFLCNPLRGLSR